MVLDAGLGSDQDILQSFKNEFSSRNLDQSKPKNCSYSKTNLTENVFLLIPALTLKHNNVFGLTK